MDAEGNYTMCIYICILSGASHRQGHTKTLCNATLKSHNHVIDLVIDENIVSWEPEGRYQYSKMFCWEPEGCYRCTMSMVIAPFWFSTEHLWIMITPFWLSTEHLWIMIAPFWLSTDDIRYKLVVVNNNVHPPPSLILMITMHRNAYYQHTTSDVTLYLFMTFYSIVLYMWKLFSYWYLWCYLAYKLQQLIKPTRSYRYSNFPQEN